ncbi:MAG: 2-C-methyl-D-erythritol 4-phosphate cytidylyltransferase [Candidatus Omnitrophica bacterium]|nr:2-C-methyl-D-erythritol 4-phosphate cytidylyltransferase [Candidatus Omnitrophota bacterium]
MKIVAVVPSAGRGVRFKQKQPKPLVLLDSYPILFHTIRTLSISKLIDNIVLVVNRNDLAKFRNKIKPYNFKKIKNIVAGGASRRKSVENGLKSVDSDADLILIHDAARPFINSKIISQTINAAKKSGAAIAAVPVKSTIKQIRPATFLVEKTLDRNILWEIQTPQVFKKDIILKAYSKFKNIDAFDDASLVEKLGKRVKIVLGSYNNIKITTPEDLLFAKAILKNRSS